jgi:hypothetical protein
MENFYLYISKPITQDEFDFWVDSNDICFLKLELYRDFVVSLVDLIYNTYLGGDTTNETKITLSYEEELSHFNWCWGKTIENFKKEGLEFEMKGDHYDFIKTFIDETFYGQKSNDVKMSLTKFFNEVFNVETMFTKSDLDLLTTLYKNLEKNMKLVYN